MAVFNAVRVLWRVFLAEFGMSLHDIALWIGYAAMVAGGIGLACLMLWLALEFAWSLHKRYAKMGVVFDAISEFRKKYPERFTKCYEEKTP